MKGFGGIGDLGKIVKQAQEMKEKMEEVQRNLEQEVVVGSAGGGMVKARVNGKLRLVGLEIEKEVVNPDDITMLQDLVVAAVNEAQNRAQEMSMEKARDALGPLAGGFNLPGML